MTDYRRQRQLDYNKKHKITPRSVERAVESSLSWKPGQKSSAADIINDAGGDFDVTETIREIEEEMVKAADNLEFEKAALLRDQIKELKQSIGQSDAPQSVSYGIKRKKKKATAKKKRKR